MAKATFAAGCFWGVEAAFREVKGVQEVISGYTGGTLENPTYEQVCAGDTGHAEAVEVTYDEKVVSYEDLLDVFWKLHDPTQVNRQGSDVDKQYRSAIFYHSEEQRKTAEAAKKKQQKNYSEPIVTEIMKAGHFFKAEEYHQRYHEKHGGVC